LENQSRPTLFPRARTFTRINQYWLVPGAKLRVIKICRIASITIKTKQTVKKQEN